ncbi:MAG: hypothetical protein R2867_23975 [Caldilineaceae bacterium]
MTNAISIITECLVPNKAVDRFPRIVTSRRDDEKVTGSALCRQV